MSQNTKRWTAARRVATCERKVTFRTIGEAVGVWRRQTALGVMPYKCAVCGRFHLGKPSGHDLKRMFQR